MPQETISPGDTVELYRADTPATILSIRAEGGDIRHAKSQAFARHGALVADGEKGHAEFLDREEPIHVHAPSSNSGDVTVYFERQGYLFNYSPTNEISTTLTDVTVANVPIDIDAVNADVPIKLSSGLSALDINLDASNIDVPIKTGSVGEIDINQSIRSSDSTVDVNADQTTNVSSGTVTSSITPPADTLWILQNVRLEAPSYSSNDSHRFTIQTQSDGVELAFGEASGSHSGTTNTGSIEFKSGVWLSDSSSTLSGDERANFEGTRLIPTNGIDVIYEEFAGNTQTNDRIIRLHLQEIDI